MAGNSKLVMSKEGDPLISLVKNELGINDNPAILKIAFAKGLTHCTEEPRDFGSGGWTIPAGVIAKDDEYLIYKHLMINQLGQPIEDKEVDLYLLRYIEEGLRHMEKEIKGLSNLDNYMIQLVSNL